MLKKILKFDNYDFSDDFLLSRMAMLIEMGDPRHLKEILEIENFLNKEINYLTPGTIQYIQSFRDYFVRDWRILKEDEMLDRR